jgi:hypothetical protein
LALVENALDVTGHHTILDEIQTSQVSSGVIPTADLLGEARPSSRALETKRIIFW